MAPNFCKFHRFAICRENQVLTKIGCFTVGPTKKTFLVSRDSRNFNSNPNKKKNKKKNGKYTNPVNNFCKQKLRPLP